MAPTPIKTDEPFDRVFSRPAASVIVALLHRTPITPNQVTFIATLFGIGVGVSLAFRHGYAAAGCVLAYLAFDCADGQLARKRGGSSGYLGRAVDGIGDYISAVAMHLGLIAWLGQKHGWIPGVAWGLAAGLSAAWASFLLDRYKRLYSGTMDDPVAIKAEADATPGWRGWMIGSMVGYCTKLDGGLRVPDLPAYQQRMRGPLVLFLYNGPTSHFFWMTIFFALYEPMFYAWLAVIPLNGLSLGTLLWQRKLERVPPPVIESAEPADAPGL